MALHTHRQKGGVPLYVETCTVVDGGIQLQAVVISGTYLINSVPLHVLPSDYLALAPGC